MMGKKTRKILETVEKILKQQEKMVKSGQGTQDQERMAEQSDRLEQLIKSGQEVQGQKLEQLTKAVSQHDLALTDLIDSWEEIQEAHHQETEQLRQERDAVLRTELHNVEKRERDLLALEMETLDQLFLLEKAMEDMPQWREQLDMIRQQLALKQQMAGLTVILQPDVPVNYDIHEVTEVWETTDEHKDAAVAEVYQPGYLYQGTVLKKAVVAAWKYHS